MPFTRLQVQQRIARNLEDITGIFYTPRNIQESMQDGYNELVLRSECIEQVSNISFTNGTLYYDIYNTLLTPKYWKPTRMFNRNTNRWLPVGDSRLFDKYQFNWEATSGTPWWAYVVNFEWISFFPHYVVGADLSFDIMYKVAPDDLLSDSQLIQIPDQFISSLEYWCTGDLLEQAQEVNKAQEWFERADVVIADLSKHTKERMFTDLYQQLNDLDFPYPTLP